MWLLFLLVVAPLPAAEPGPNRIVRVVSVSQDGLDRSDENTLNKTIERLERAAAFRPDIAALPEVFVDGEPETVPGPVTRRLAEWAKRHASYVLFGIKTRTGGRVHNSAVLLNRKGELVGQYNKIHPTEGELQQGVHPGEPGATVFNTDFGVIGVQICFDVNWWDDWKALKEKGAKIVFFPAAYPAARQLAAIALMNQFYAVSSTRDRPSRIYDITGMELAASGRFQPWAAAALPIGKRLFEIDFHTRKAREIQLKYGDRIDLKWYHDDDWFTLASLDPELTVEQLIAEFGLIPLDDYRVRAGKAIDEARSKHGR
jgi:predicted amidohydrolase